MTVTSCDKTDIHIGPKQTTHQKKVTEKERKEQTEPQQNHPGEDTRHEVSKKNSECS